MKKKLKVHLVFVFLFMVILLSYVDDDYTRIRNLVIVPR